MSKIKINKIISYIEKLKEKVFMQQTEETCDKQRYKNEGKWLAYLEILKIIEDVDND